MLIIDTYSLVWDIDAINSPVVNDTTSGDDEE
jgi:hypothetical protein